MADRIDSSRSSLQFSEVPEVGTHPTPDRVAREGDIAPNDIEPLVSEEIRKV